MARVTILDTLPPAPLEACARLEAGEILVGMPTLLEESELAPLRACNRIGGTHKNIAYARHSGRLTGVRAGARDAAGLQRSLAIYTERITAWVENLCPTYANQWTADLTSFRPLDEASRTLRGRARNDRLHIDAFPSRPTHGDRILRVFTNIHPSQPRCWLTGDALEQLLPRLHVLPGFPQPRAGIGTGTLRRRVAQRLGLPALGRSAYDRTMLRLHDFMKASDAAQRLCHPSRHDFDSGQSWLVFTDTVPHAVLSGQYALEHTFIVPHAALSTPERSPLALLEEFSTQRRKGRKDILPS